MVFTQINILNEINIVLMKFIDFIDFSYNVFLLLSDVDFWKPNLKSPYFTIID